MVGGWWLVGGWVGGWMGEIKIIDHLSPVGTETGTELGNNIPPLDIGYTFYYAFRVAFLQETFYNEIFIIH